MLQHYIGKLSISITWFFVQNSGRIPRLNVTTDNCFHISTRTSRLKWAKRLHASVQPWNPPVCGSLSPLLGVCTNHQSLFCIWWDLMDAGRVWYIGHHDVESPTSNRPYLRLKTMMTCWLYRRVVKGIRFKLSIMVVTNPGILLLHFALQIFPFFNGPSPVCWCQLWYVYSRN